MKALSVSIYCLAIFNCLSVSAQDSVGEQALFGELPVVEAAALHAQTLEQAPANVTIISAADIQTYGYRTLGEALASVRGFDITYDDLYHYVGIHGISLPGDYNTRFLVMINGHSMTENVYDSNNFFGQDFGLDMDLIQRIEVIRGPSSALYGSNGILATINIVTKSPVDQPRLRASAETDTFGERKAELSVATDLGHGANLLFETSVFNSAGENVFVPDFANPATNNGFAQNVNGERGYHTFANLLWRKWTLTAYFNSRQKQAPVAWDPTALFNIRGDYVQDRRNFISVSRTDSVGAGQLRVDVSYDQYRYSDRFYYPLNPSTEDGTATVEDFRNLARGDWLTAKTTYTVPVKSIGGFTAGLNVDYDLQNVQCTHQQYPTYAEQLYISHPDRGLALFAQQEWKISQRWTATLGGRLDESRNFGHFLSPRAALVFKQSARTVYKFVYGHPFRNPSAYEQFYADGIVSLANPNLRQETAQTFELSAERKLKKNLTAIANVFDYRIDNVIQTVFFPDGQQQFQNVSWLRSQGAEFELDGKFKRFEAGASLSFQDARGPAGGLANSAEVLAKGHASLSLLRGLTLAATLYSETSRLTFSGQSLSPVALTDLTLTWHDKRRSWQAQFGVRNLFNYLYEDPIDLAVDNIQAEGRSVFFKLTWQFGG